MAADLVPVLSYAMLRGKCRYCKQSISWRYAAIELLTGVLFLAVAAKFGMTWDTIFHCLFVAVLICVFFIDLEHFVIPDGLNLLCIVIGVAANSVAIASGEPGGWGVLFKHQLPASIKGLLVYAGIIYGVGWVSYIVIVSTITKKRGIVAAAWNYVRENVGDWFFLLVYYVSRIVTPLRKFVEEPEPLDGITADDLAADDEAGGMGGGDGKLAAGIGSNLGWAHSLQAAVFALFLGVIFGLAVMFRDKKSLGARTAIPFGPSMAIGALIAMFIGPDIARWYISHFWTFPGSPFATG